jgi:hypothetical protein
MPRFLHAAARGLFYPAMIIAITIALSANHGTAKAAAATYQAGTATLASHREPMSHIAKAPRGDRHHEPIAHIAKAPKGARKPRTA